MTCDFTIIDGFRVASSTLFRSQFGSTSGMCFFFFEAPPNGMACWDRLSQTDIIDHGEIRTQVSQGRNILSEQLSHAHIKKQK